MKNSYTWKASYVLPYESLYSIREKFCYLNAVDWSYFIHVRDRIDGVEGLNHLYYYSGLGVKIIPGFSLPCYEEVRYCPLCVQYGYHSVFHQAIPFRNCFIHKRQSLIRIAERRSTMRVSDSCYGIQGQYLNASPKIEDVIYPAGLLKSAKLIWRKLKNISSLYYLDPNNYKYTDDWIINNSASKFIQMLIQDKQPSGRGITLIMQKTDEELFRNDYNDYYGNSTAGIVKSFVENKINEEFSDCHEYFREIANLIDNINLCKEYSSKYASIIIIFATIYVYNERLLEKFKDSWLNSYSVYLNLKNRLINTMDEMEKLKRNNQDDFHYRNMDVFKEVVLKEAFEFAQSHLAEYLNHDFDWMFPNGKNVFLAELPIRYPQFYLVKKNDLWSLYKCVG